jgi:glycosyltransferase involved in cell wall biosynthesis
MFNPVALPPTVAPWPARQAGSVLFLGKLGKAKGVDDLLQACAELTQRCPSLHLALGGDGDRSAVQQQADALGVARHVELLGWVQGEQKTRLLNSCRIYVLPSYFEGLPMSILEAMASGVPVIATAIGGIPEAIQDGVEGYLLAPGDVQGLADRIARLLADDALAQRMGAAGRSKVERQFSTAAVMPRLEQIYTDLGLSAV